jgi:hypothetical protein
LAAADFSASLSLSRCCRQSSNPSPRSM